MSVPEMMMSLMLMLIVMTINVNCGSEDVDHEARVDAAEDADGHDDQREYADFNQRFSCLS